MSEKQLRFFMGNQGAPVLNLLGILEVADYLSSTKFFASKIGRRIEAQT